MKKETGYIKLFRTIESWEWFGNPNMVYLWIWLLLKANWEDTLWQGETIPRGSLVTTVSELAEVTKMSAWQVRKCLAHMQISKELTIKTTKYKLMHHKLF